MIQVEKTITRNWGKPGSHTLAVYREAGGYAGLKKALEIGRAQITEEVKKSNLRGRGGAGFYTAVKWGFVPKNSSQPTYLAVNADESEPGTFKDRYILENDPHMLLEGIAIAALALDCHHAYIYTRGEFKRQAEIVNNAIAEAYRAGILGDQMLGKDHRLDVYQVRGAGAYICGEETALLESLEGKKGWPRLKPPFPAVVGLFGAPTVVNNVETLAALPSILDQGAGWFAGLGTAKSGGTRLVCLSGSVNRPGVYEISMKTTVRELIFDPELGQGMPPGRTVKAVIPGGTSAPVMAADELDVALEFEALKDKGTMAGSGGVIVMDDATAIAPYPPIGLGNTICALGDAAALPVHSFVEKFRPEFEAHIKQKGCPFGGNPWGAFGGGRG